VSKGRLLLAVLAQPGARREGFAGLHDGRLRVRTRTAQEAGKAGTAVSVLVATAFGLAWKAVSLVSGSTSRRKELVLEGLPPAEAGELLQQQQLV
jgi:uncharacterized protein YggU (UPF0235/DUF167 family)